MYYTYQPDGTYREAAGVAPVDVSTQLDGISSVLHDLQSHKMADEARFSALESSIHSIKSSQAHPEHISYHSQYKDSKMSHETPVIFNTPPAHGMGNDMFGMGGGGLIGGLVLGSLLRNGNGFLGGNGVAEVGVPAANVSLATLQAIGDVKAAVPLASCQTIAAINDAQADITNTTLQQTIGLNASIAGSKDATVNAAANIGNLIQTVNNSLGDKVDANTTQQAIGFGALNTNIERVGWSLSQAITNDGDKTRALISSIDRDNLNRQLTVAENALIEERAERARASDRHGIEITMIQNNNQLQQQQQQQGFLLNSLVHGLNEVSQIAKATNQNVLVGNTGFTATGAQTANPTNVKV